MHENLSLDIIFISKIIQKVGGVLNLQFVVLPKGAKIYDFDAQSTEIIGAKDPSPNVSNGSLHQ